MNTRFKTVTMVANADSMIFAVEMSEIILPPDRSHFSPEAPDAANGNPVVPLDVGTRHTERLTHSDEGLGAVNTWALGIRLTATLDVQYGTFGPADSSAVRKLWIGLRNQLGERLSKIDGLAELLSVRAPACG
jgi:hypothetical protein